MGKIGRGIFSKLITEEEKERLERFVAENFPDGYDEFGASPDTIRGNLPLAMFLYKKWFRVIVRGLENIPSEGRALIIGNHSGQIPLDGMMIMVACMTQLEKPRLPRTMVEKWFPTLPFVGTMFTRAGQLVGVTENAERILEKGEILMIFPEGALGSGKTWNKRYRLQRFTPGFMELAIKYKTPIIPVSVIGGEEQAPSFFNVKPIADALGMPYFPITPTFPWTGPFGFIPYPSRYRITFGEPLDFSMYGEELDDPEKIRVHIETVHSLIQDMVNEGLKERPFPGF